MGDDVSLAIEQLYASVLRPDELPAALGAVSRLFRGSHAFLTAMEPGAKGILWGASFGLDLSDQARFMSAEASEMAKPIMARMQFGVPIGITDIYTDKDWSRLPYYNEVVRPMHGYHSLSFHDPRHAAPFQVVICRNQAIGNYDNGERQLLTRFVPHFRMSLELARRLDPTGPPPSSWSHWIEMLDHPAIVTDHRGIPCLINADAELLLTQGLGLSLHTALRGPVHETTAELIALIGGAARDETGVPIFYLIRGRNETCPLLLRLVRLQRPGLPSMIDGRAQVVIFVKRLTRPKCADIGMIAKAFNLTPREADIASHLSGGLRFDEIALRLGIGLGTIRFHIKNIFRKTETNSQSALVALLHGASF